MTQGMPHVMCPSFENLGLVLTCDYLFICITIIQLRKVMMTMMKLEM